MDVVGGDRDSHLCETSLSDPVYVMIPYSNLNIKNIFFSEIVPFHLEFTDVHWPIFPHTVSGSDDVLRGDQGSPTELTSWFIIPN